MRRKILTSLIKIILASSMVFVLPAHAEITSCRVEYSIEGWSFLYKDYKGVGIVRCVNGQQANVSIVSKGGGVTFGKSKIDRGTGTFSKVYDIKEIYGTYFSIDGHAGAVSSVEGRAMTKGEVSLVLTGKGRGFDFGFSFSGFTIKPM
jgi:hypothetical protein